MRSELRRRQKLKRPAPPQGVSSASCQRTTAGSEKPRTRQLRLPCSSIPYWSLGKPRESCPSLNGIHQRASSIPDHHDTRPEFPIIVSDTVKNCIGAVISRTPFTFDRQYGTIDPASSATLPQLKADHYLVVPLLNKSVPRSHTFSGMKSPLTNFQMAARAWRWSARTA